MKSPYLLAALAGFLIAVSPAAGAQDSADETGGETPEQRRDRFESMTAEQRAAARASARERRESMSDEERAEARKQKRGNRDANRAKMRERRDSMSDDERAEARQRMQNRRQRGDTPREP